ncbi:hypothetical protein BC834DRAFT_688151 [Gloeopeniophorella convolvens]|nr:hypothetical protein BC834DRAFT_688151 [Gloeopeniophorella convolvens]
MALTEANFDPAAVLAYLGLPSDYIPSPVTAPISFLTKHLYQLPYHLLSLFSAITTPQQRTVIPSIRNRRFNFTQSDPPELRFVAAKRRWSILWEGPSGGQQATDEGQEEKEWAEASFLGGERKPYVGKLGMLLREYEEERQAEQARLARRGRPAPAADADGFVPEEDESSDDDQDLAVPESQSAQGRQELFLRRVRERFIYGQLEVTGIFMTSLTGMIPGTRRTEMPRIVGSMMTTDFTVVDVAALGTMPICIVRSAWRFGYPCFQTDGIGRSTLGVAFAAPGHVCSYEHVLLPRRSCYCEVLTHIAGCLSLDPET